MVALLPATATVIGIVVLAQLPSAAELAGVVLVIGGVAVHRQQDASADSLHSDSREEYGRVSAVKLEGEA